MHVFGKQLVGEFLLVVDAGDRDNGEFAQMAVHQHRLGVGVGNHADSGVADEFAEFRLELGPEVSVFKTVDAAEKALVGAVGNHTAAAGAEVRLIVGSVEKVCCTRFFLGDGSKKSSHFRIDYSYSCQLLILIWSSLLRLTASTNADARRAFVSRGMLWSIAPRRM